MESQPQNPEFRNTPEIFRPCNCVKSMFNVCLYMLFHVQSIQIKYV